MKLHKFKALRRAQARRSAVAVAAPAALAVPVRRQSTPEDVFRLFMSSKARRTLESYQEDLLVFAGWLGTDVKSAIGVLLSQDAGGAHALAADWLASMTLSKATQARRIATLRSLTKLARQLGVITWRLETTTPRVEGYRDTRGVDLPTFQRMLELCGQELQGARNRAMLVMLLTLGLRRNELVGLQREHFEHEPAPRLRIKGKGAEPSWVTMPEETVRVLDVWIEAYEEELGRQLEPTDALFCALDRKNFGRPLSGHGLWQVVTRIGRAAGVKTWPHGIRHTAITQALNMNPSLREVQRFSRHAKIETLMIYDDNRKDFGGQIAKQLAELVTKK